MEKREGVFNSTHWEVGRVEEDGPHVLDLPWAHFPFGKGGW